MSTINEIKSIADTQNTHTHTHTQITKIVHTILFMSSSTFFGIPYFSALLLSVTILVYHASEYPGSDESGIGLPNTIKPTKHTYHHHTKSSQSSIKCDLSSHAGLTTIQSLRSKIVIVVVGVELIGWLGGFFGWISRRLWCGGMNE